MAILSVSDSPHIQLLDQIITELYAKPNPATQRPFVEGLIKSTERQEQLDEISMIMAALDYLVHLGFVTRKDVSFPSRSSIQYITISMQGLIFVEKHRKGNQIRPFQTQAMRDMRETKLKFWKTFALATNSVAILFFAGVQAYSAFKVIPNPSIQHHHEYNSSKHSDTISVRCSILDASPKVASSERQTIDKRDNQSLYF